jgi:hypothetical protein
VTISKVMLTYMNSWKTTSAKWNSGRKSTLTERDRRTLRRIVSKNRRNTAAQVTAELNIHQEDPVSTKLSDMSCTVRLQLLSLWLLKVIFRYVNNGVMTIKPGHQTTGNARVIWSDEPSITLFSTSGRVYVENTQGSLQSGTSGSNSETRGRFCNGLSSNIMVLVPLLPFMAELLQGSTWTGWEITCILWSRRYFRETMQFPKTTMLPFSQLQLFSRGIKSVKTNCNIFSDQHNHQIWTPLNHSGQFWRPEWGTHSHLQHL